MLPNLKDVLTKHLPILQANQSCIKSFSTLSIIPFKKGTDLKQIIYANTIHNNEKPIKNKKISLHRKKMQHATQHVDFAANNLIQQQHSKVIKPTLRLKSTIKSSLTIALLFTY